MKEITVPVFALDSSEPKHETIKVHPVGNSDLCVHLTLRKKRGSWNITHMPTGLAILFGFADKQDALQVARELTVLFPNASDRKWLKVKKNRAYLWTTIDAALRRVGLTRDPDRWVVPAPRVVVNYGNRPGSSGGLEEIA